MALEDIPGQERAAALLRAALRSGRLAHAYLFVGPSGMGRLAMARELASVLLCPEGGAQPFGDAQGKACGACKSCRSLESGNHPDYYEAGVPEGKQELPIALVQMLQDRAAVKPFMAPRRVFVVKDAERMNQEAANCFLKTLEEPPGGSCFILIAAGLWDMPQTVVSRCRVVKFTGLPPGRVEEVLRGDGLDAEDAWWLARRSWGSPGLAVGFKHIGLHSANRELAEKLLALSAADGLALRPAEAYGLTDWLSARADDAAQSRPQARAALQELLECAAVFYRDLAALAIAPGEAEVFNRGLEERLRELASRCSVESLIECADRVFDAIERVGANANRQVALDDLFSQLSVISDHCRIGGAEPS